MSKHRDQGGVIREVRVQMSQGFPNEYLCQISGLKEASKHAPSPEDLQADSQSLDADHFVQDESLRQPWSCAHDIPHLGLSIWLLHLIASRNGCRDLPVQSSALTCTTTRPRRVRAPYPGKVNEVGMLPLPHHQPASSTHATRAAGWLLDAHG